MGHSPAVDPDLQDLYQRYFEILRRKCHRMLPNAEEAEDVVQETFIRLWQSRARFEQPHQILAWLYRTSTRLAVDRLRRNRARAALASTALPPTVAPSLESELHYRLIWGQLAQRMTAEELELAVLTYLDRMSQVEIAQTLGTSERTVRRRLSALESRIARLREELDS